MTPLTNIRASFGAQHTPATARRKLTQRDSRAGFTADAGHIPSPARHAGPVAPGTGRSNASTPAAGVTTRSDMPRSLGPLPAAESVPAAP